MKKTKQRNKSKEVIVVIHRTIYDRVVRDINSKEVTFDQRPQ